MGFPGLVASLGRSTLSQVKLSVERRNPALLHWPQTKSNPGSPRNYITSFQKIDRHPEKNRELTIIFIYVRIMKIIFIILTFSNHEK
jgi:hypothetical protein